MLTVADFAPEVRILAVKIVEAEQAMMLAGDGWQGIAHVG